MRNLCRLLVTILLVAPVSAFAVDNNVNINDADKYELHEQLTGVTREIADNIVEYRAKNGDFKNVEEMEQVEGVGYDTLNINRDNIVVGNAS